MPRLPNPSNSCPVLSHSAECHPVPSCSALLPFVPRCPIPTLLPSFPPLPPAAFSSCGPWQRATHPPSALWDLGRVAHPSTCSPRTHSPTSPEGLPWDLSPHSHWAGGCPQAPSRCTPTETTLFSTDLGGELTANKAPSPPSSLATSCFGRWEVFPPSSGPGPPGSPAVRQSRAWRSSGRGARTGASSWFCP